MAGGAGGQVSRRQNICQVQCFATRDNHLIQPKGKTGLDRPCESNVCFLIRIGLDPVVSFHPMLLIPPVNVTFANPLHTLKYGPEYRETLHEAEAAGKTRERGSPKWKLTLCDKMSTGFSPYSIYDFLSLFQLYESVRYGAQTLYLYYKGSYSASKFFMCHALKIQE